MLEAKVKLTHHTIFEYLREHFDVRTVAQFCDMDWHYIRINLKKFLNERELEQVAHSLGNFLQEFVGDFGSISVRFIKGKMHVEYQTSPKMLQAFDVLKTYIPKLEKPDMNLYIFNQATTKALKEELACKDDEEFRSIIRKTFVHVCEVGQRHSILFGKSRITIRLFIERGGKEKRFSGIPKDALQEIVANVFSNVKRELKVLLPPKLKHAVDFANMSNEQYDAQHVKRIQDELFLIIAKRNNQDEETNKALANYILRENFEFVHALLADQLLDDILSSRGSSEQFLAYYARGTISLGGINYRVPPIEDESGTQWSVANIKNITLQYKGIMQERDTKKALVEEMTQSLETTKEELHKAKEHLKSKQQELESAQTRLKSIVDAMNSMRMQIKQLEQSKEPTAQEEQALLKKLKALQDQEPKLIAHKRTFEPAITKVESTIRDLIQKERTLLQRIEKEQERIDTINSNNKALQEKYSTMHNALSRALSMRKERL